MSSENPSAKSARNRAKASSGPSGVDEIVTLGGTLERVPLWAGGVGIIALGVACALGVVAGDHFRNFLFSYLVAFMFVLAIGLGGLFWVTLQHLVGAEWSTAVRRIGEIIAGTLPWVSVLALPVVLPAIFGYSGLFKWVDDAFMDSLASLAHKKPYLNTTFFGIRSLVYLGFWALFGTFLFRRSVRHDQSGAEGLLASLRRAAPLGMIAFAVTLTFAAIDFIMTLDPTWFSTIFGVYYFAGCVLSVHSTMVLLLMLLQRNGRLTRSVTVDHFHDLGKMMFAFVVFWSYIAFSQFMLIWYANIPEETAWYRIRMEGGWGWVSLALLFGHFLLPFLGLISRHVKRHRAGLAFWAIWLLVFEYVDLYWLIMPNLNPEGVPFGVMDLLVLLGVVSLFVAALAWCARGNSLIPVRDPRLAKSLAFENV